jgi:hypothetical protein
LQSKFSVAWRCDKQRGFSPVKMIRSQMLDSFEEYDFIDTFANETYAPITPSPTALQAPAINNRNRNRKSIALKQSIMKNGRKLIYTAEWELSFDLVIEFDLATGDHREKLLKIDILEHRNNDQNIVGTVTVNLVEFTSPPPIFSIHSSTLKRLVLIPVVLQSHKRAKLKMSVSSLWLKLQQQQVMINTQRNRIDPYFILDESEEDFSPRPSATTTNNNTFSHHSSPNAKMTPRALTKRSISKPEVKDSNDQSSDSSSETKTTPRDRDKLVETINKKVNETTILLIICSMTPFVKM